MFLYWNRKRFLRTTISSLIQFKFIHTDTKEIGTWYNWSWNLNQAICRMSNMFISNFCDCESRVWVNKLDKLRQLAWFFSLSYLKLLNKFYSSWRSQSMLLHALKALSQNYIENCLNFTLFFMFSTQQWEQYEWSTEIK